MPIASARLVRLEMRSRALKSIRAFFAERDYVEVETPVRIETPALELHIDAEPSGDHYLRTSPELHMKRLVCEGMHRVFQMGPCFRRGERGRRHSPEYTMLEWYRRDADYLDILDETRVLLSRVCLDVLGSTEFVYGDQTVDMSASWSVLNVADVFVRWAGWNPVKAYNADRFDLDLVEKIEPALPANVPVALKDYPAEAAALARCRPDNPPVAERWELYVAGMELANAFSELTDPVEQRRRFEACAEARARLGKAVYGVDQAFLTALEQGMPDCAGVALGIDRLVMLMTHSATIDEVRAF